MDRILELGCGTGILGMILAQFFADFHQHHCQNHHHRSSLDAVGKTHANLPSSSSSCELPACLVLTDGDAQALELLQQNLMRNQIVRRRSSREVPFSSNEPDDEDDGNEPVATTNPNPLNTPTEDEDDATAPLGFPVHATRLLWGTDDPDTLQTFQLWCHETLNDRTTTTTTKNQPPLVSSSSSSSSWKTDQTTNATTHFPFDVIVAGDVLYKPELISLFFATARALLLSTTMTHTALSTDAHDDGGDGVLWLCHVPRFTVTHECVVQGAQQAGFMVELVADGHDWVKDATATSTILACPMADVLRAKIYRMRLVQE